jgi:hypothetical protein
VFTQTEDAPTLKKNCRMWINPYFVRLRVHLASVAWEPNYGALRFFPQLVNELHDFRP